MWSLVFYSLLFWLGFSFFGVFVWGIFPPLFVFSLLVLLLYAFFYPRASWPSFFGNSHPGFSSMLVMVGDLGGMPPEIANEVKSLGAAMAMISEKRSGKPVDIDDLVAVNYSALGWTVHMFNEPSIQFRGEDLVEVLGQLHRAVFEPYQLAAVYQ